jgi:large subunit ribosomal protein L6
MSRVGKQPIPVPSGVEISVDPTKVVVKGPKGTLTQDYKPLVTISVDDGVCTVTRKNETKPAKSMHGLYQRLVQNMVTGVTTGFTRVLVINGVGYRAEQQGQSLVLSLGYSMPIQYPIPSDLQVELEGPNKIRISGIDKQRVGQMASEIRSLRPPEPYKGKGVKYEEEQIIRKVGKSGIK